MLQLIEKNPKINSTSNSIDFKKKRLKKEILFSNSHMQQWTIIHSCSRLEIEGEKLEIEVCRGEGG